MNFFNIKKTVWAQLKSFSIELSWSDAKAWSLLFVYNPSNVEYFLDILLNSLHNN